MKALNYLFPGFVLLVMFACGFCVGYNANRAECTKHYEAACLQADFIRFAIDHFDGDTLLSNVGAEIEESYFEFFTDMHNRKTDYITDVKDFDQYSWCY
jgi:hypothetical protein